MTLAHPSIPQPTRFIDPEALTRISNLELVARTVVEGFISGLHRSPHLGFSVNFAEYRPYRPGDDIRKIDWKVLGRLDRFFVKEYEGETNTGVTILLDCSRSMAFGRRGIEKLVYGKFLAASLGYFAFRQRDGVGLVVFDSCAREFVPARGSIGHLNTVLHTIERTQPGERSNFSLSLVSVAERLRRRGIVVLISDLYDESGTVMDGLRQLAFRGNDVIVFHVLDPSEMDFDYSDSARFVDLETASEMPVIPEFVQLEYRKILREQLQYFERECLRDRMDYVHMSTSEPLDHALFSYLLRRQQLY